MAQCVVPVVLDGVSVLALSSDTTCSSFVALTPAEYAAMSSSPFLLSVSDGALVSLAIVGTWCIGWSWRALRQTLNSGDSE